MAFRRVRRRCAEARRKTPEATLVIQDLLQVSYYTVYNTNSATRKGILHTLDKIVPSPDGLDAEIRSQSNLRLVVRLSHEQGEG